jgi:subfamily B ATP-binding cassette protein MsbA
MPCKAPPLDTAALTFDAGPMTTLTSRALAARIWRDYLKRRWPSLATAMLMAAITAGLTAVLARLLEPATNGIFGKEPTHRLWLIPAAIVGVALLRMVAQALQAGLTNRIGHRLVGDIQSQLYGRLLRADLARLRAAHTGGFVSQVLYDAGLIREAATNGVVNYTQHGLTVIAMLGVMLYLDPMLTLVVLVAAPPSAWSPAASPASRARPPRAPWRRPACWPPR